MKRIILIVVWSSLLVLLTGSVQAAPWEPRRPSGLPELAVTALQVSCQRVSSSDPTCLYLSGQQWDCAVQVEVENRGGTTTGTGFDVCSALWGEQISGSPKTVPLGILRLPAAGPGERVTAWQTFHNVACAVRYTAGPHAGLWGMVHHGVEACVQRAMAWADPEPDSIEESNEDNNGRGMSVPPCAPGQMFLIHASRHVGGP